MRSWLRHAFHFLPVVSVVTLIIHFGMTLAYLLPLNPIMLRIAPLVDGYMVPWFVQDWHLFAPDPINETQRLLVSCRLQQTNGLTVETPWMDVSTPLWDIQAHERFSAAAWLARPQSSAIQLYFDQSDLLTRLERHVSTDDSDGAHIADEIRLAADARRAFATHVLARLGSAYCDQWYGTGQTIATRLCLSVLRFPRFSQRQLPDTDGALHFYPFAWTPYERVSPLLGTSE